MAKLSLEALELVSGGMDVRTLQTHLGGAGHIGAPGSGGPGFAPLLQHGGSTLGLPGAAGLDPYAQGTPYQSALAAAPLTNAPAEHHSSFAEDLQAITGVMNAFVGMIGQLSGHGAAATPDAPTTTTSHARASQEQSDQPDQTESPGPVAHAQDDTSDVPEAAPVGTSHAAGDDGVGGHTNFRETATGFERT